VGRAWRRALYTRSSPFYVGDGRSSTAPTGMYCCGTTLFILQSRGLGHRLLNKGPRRLRELRNSLIPPYKKGPTRSVRGAQSTMPPSAHGLHRYDSNVNVLRLHSTHALGRKVPESAPGNRLLEKHERWISNTLTEWLNEVTSAMRERALEGFSWTSHSLRKGAMTAAYNVGVTLQKIRYFCG
jgi:hypothetical protein